MSGQCTGWVLRHGPKNRAQRAVLVTIADAANRDGKHAHPGIEAMVEGSLYSRSHVKRIVAQLLEDGWIEEEAPGGGRGLATEYSVIMKEKPVPGGPVSGSETGPSGPSKPAHPSSETGPSEPKPVPPDEPPTVSTTVKPTEVLSTEGSLTLAGVEVDDSLGFEEFWDVYPPRNGKKLNKRLAVAHWQRLSLADRRAAWRGARNYAAAVEAGLTIAKDPDRFLKHRVWEDWQEPAIPTARGGPRASVVERSFAAIAHGPKHGIR